MEEDITVIVEMIAKEKEKRDNLRENYTKFKDLYGEDSTIARFTKANLENPNKELEELKKYTPKLLEEKNNLENLINKLKERNKVWKKAGREILLQIKKDEKNNVQNKTRYKSVNKLARAVKKLDINIENKENLLKSINTSLEILDYQETQKDKNPDDLIDEYLKTLNNVYEEESEKARAKEEEEKKKENKGFRKLISRGLNTLNSAMSGIKRKWSNFKESTGLFGKNKESSTKSEVSESQEIQENDKKINIDMPAVDNSNGQVEQRAMEAMEAKAVTENKNTIGIKNTTIR